MLFVNYKISAPIGEVVKSLSLNDDIINAEKISTDKGHPLIHSNVKGKNISMVCEMTKKPTRDIDFRFGTRLFGCISESKGITHIRGIILTAPIYHLLLLILFGYFIYRCITLGGISIVPICLLLFDIFMFKEEFKKQGIIKKYLFGALKLTYKRLNPDKK